MSEERQPPAPQPTLKKIDLTIARLRILLADVSAREAAVEDQRRTCRDQHNKLVTFSIYGDTSLDSVLTMLRDVQERLDHLESTAQALSAIRKRAENELESLQLTKGIEEAKVLLQQLQAQQAEPVGALSATEIQTEIARLQSLINEASERAAKSIERSSRRG